MAIDRRELSDGSASWRVRIFQRGAVIATKTFPTRGDAVLWEREQQRSVSLGMNLSGASLPFSSWVETWKAGRPQRAPGTVRRQESLLRLHILPVWGPVPVEQIRRSDLRSWARGLSESASPSTARLAVGVVAQVLQCAVDDRALVGNPARALGFSTVARNAPVALSHDQLWRLADWMSSEAYRMATLVMGYCGLRLGEAAALNVSDVDFESATLTVYRSFSLVGTTGYRRQLRPTKTHATRTVVIPATVAGQLLHSVQARHTLHAKSLSKPLFYFADTPAHRLDQDKYRALLRHASRTLSDFPTHFTPHNLRDTCAMNALAAGAQVADVSRLLGHESIEVTLRHYVAATPGGVQSIAAAFEVEAQQAQKGTKDR